MVERRQVFRNAQGKRSLKIIKLQTLEINTQVLTRICSILRDDSFLAEVMGHQAIRDRPAITTVGSECRAPTLRLFGAGSVCVQARRQLMERKTHFMSITSDWASQCEETFTVPDGEASPPDVQSPAYMYVQSPCKHSDVSTRARDGELYETR